MNYSSDFPLKEEIREYMRKACAKRRVEMRDYWNINNPDIDEKSPIFRGDAKVIHAPAGAGKSTYLERMVRGLKSTQKSVYVMVLLIDEREVEMEDWNDCGADEIIFIPNTFRAIYGEAEMWNMSMEAFYKALKMSVDKHKDVVFVIDSLNKFATVASAAKIVPEGKTLPGGVDENAINLVSSYVGTSGNLINGGSITIWGTCLLQTESDALNKGASAILDGVVRSALVLNRDHSINNLSHSRSAQLLNESTSRDNEILPRRKYTFDYRTLYRA